MPKGQSAEESDAVLWVFRILFFAFPCLIAYGAWALSGYIFEAQDAFGRMLNWLATFAGMAMLLPLFNLLAIDLPRARKRAKFWADKQK